MKSFIKGAVAFGFLAAGCNFSSDPKLGPGSEKLSTEPQGQTVYTTVPVQGPTVVIPPPPQLPPKPPIIPPAAQEPYGMLLESEMLFTVGEYSEYQMYFNVPAPGNPVATFNGLPDGAFYSPADNKFTWAPAVGQNDDPQTPTENFRFYEMGVELTSSLDLITFLKRGSIILVRAPKAKLQIQTSSSVWDVQENLPASRALTLFSPGGNPATMTMTLNGAPAGYALTSVTPGQYLLTYNGGTTVPPSVGEKTCDAAGVCTQAFQVLLHAKDATTNQETKMTIVVRLKTKP